MLPLSYILPPPPTAYEDPLAPFGVSFHPPRRPGGTVDNFDEEFEFMLKSIKPDPLIGSSIPLNHPPRTSPPIPPIQASGEGVVSGDISEVDMTYEVVDDDITLDDLTVIRD
jgi:hypothetical protein